LWLQWTVAYALAIIVGGFVLWASLFVTGFIAAFVVGDFAAIYAAGIFSGLAGGASFGLIHWLLWCATASGASRWMLFNALAWAIGVPALMLVGNSMHEIPAGLALGLAVGVMQWLLLRKHFSYSVVWIVISLLAWTIGWEVTSKVPYGFFAAIAIIGAVTGFAMTWLLNHPKQQIASK
jgi:hypothetical protein